MRSKLVTLFVLLACLRCCRGCPQKKRLRLECNLTPLGSVIKDMTNTIKAIQNSRQDGELHIKLLKKFTNPCKKKSKVDLPVIIEILNIYQTHIFSKLGSNDKFMATLGSLQDSLEHCLDKLSANQNIKERSSRTEKNIKNLRRTFQKLDTAGLYKAVGEFKQVLGWLGMFRGTEGGRR